MLIDALLILLPLSYVLGVIVFRKRDARHRMELRQVEEMHNYNLKKLNGRYKTKLTQNNVKHSGELGSMRNELVSMKREYAEQLILMKERLESMKREHAEELGITRREYIEYHGEPLHIIDPNQYERVVAETVKRVFEYEHVEVTGGPGDRGVDVLASGHTETGRRRSAIVQYKMYADDNRVGYNYVRDLIGSMTIHNSDVAYLVTTSDFASNAVVSEEHLNNLVKLINGQQFNEWRIAAGLAPVIYAGRQQAYEE